MIGVGLAFLSFWLVLEVYLLSKDIKMPDLPEMKKGLREPPRKNVFFAEDGTVIENP